MLARSRRTQEPCVVCYVHEQICASKHKLACQIADCVFETNEWCDLHIIIGEAEHRVIHACIKIAGHPFACYRSEKRKRMSQRKVFTTQHQMHPAMTLHLLCAPTDQQRW